MGACHTIVVQAVIQECIFVQSKFMVPGLIAAVSLLAAGWIGIDSPAKRHGTRILAKGESGAFSDLPEKERKELVWMAKAANAAYPGVPKPLGYRSFSRREWDACAVGCGELVYAEDGYFNAGSGLRGRLMVNMLNEGRVVLALSGCDFDQDADAFVKDLTQCVSHYINIKAAQYEQALKVMSGVLSLKPRTDLWIVGHSLGGSMTTYLALHLPEGRTRIKCATFNGFGISPRFGFGGEKEALASSRLRNVYCEGDPVYNNIPWRKLLLPDARHVGPSYSLKCEGDWLVQHSIDNMVKLMIAKRSRWPGI